MSEPPFTILGRALEKTSFGMARGIHGLWVVCHPAPDKAPDPDKEQARGGKPLG